MNLFQVVKSTSWFGKGLQLTGGPAGMMVGVSDIEKSKAFSSPVVTQVVPLTVFYDAEEYHQNYLVRHPKDPYIVAHDLPKLANLKKQFPDLWVEK